MIRVRKSEERGRGDHGWLDTKHTFSFANYHDPAHIRFRSLRVMNEDVVAPGAGFPTHPHRDMEILSYVLSGGLEHRDSMGNGSVVGPSELQRMTAGTGVEHSEKNASERDPVHFYQIWIFPERKGLEPAYEQRAFPEEERRGRLRLAASRDGRDGALTLHQDAEIYLVNLGEEDRVEHEIELGRHAWVQVLRGEIEVNGRRLGAGDGASFSEEPRVELAGAAPASEVMLFDLA